MIRKSKNNSTVVRLNKINGQVEGIKKMYEDDPCDCISIITQIQAVRGALNQVAKNILKDEAKRCVDLGETDKLREVVNKTFNVI